MYWPATYELDLTGSIHECAVDLQDRIVDQQVAVEEAVQRLWIDLFAIVIHSGGKVSGGYVLLIDIRQ